MYLRDAPVRLEFSQYLISPTTMYVRETTIFAVSDVVFTVGCSGGSTDGDDSSGPTERETIPGGFFAWNYDPSGTRERPADGESGGRVSRWPGRGTGPGGHG